MSDMKRIDTRAFAEIARPLGARGLKISQSGTLKAYETWAPEIRRNVYSVSKSFTSAAVGMALEEGLLSLDEKLTDVFSDELPDAPNAYLEAAELRDLLTMCLGQDQAYMMSEQRRFYKEKDWVKLALSFPFTHAPGTHFVYNNVGPYLAGVLLQRRAGTDLVSYLMPRLFAPLGIEKPDWERDPEGYTFGSSGLMLTLSEIHKFGLLYLNEGKWEGRQLVPASWVEACRTPQDDPGYSYLFWLGDESYRADGKYAQFVIIFPEKEAVISLVSQCDDNDKMLKAIRETLCPQL